MRFWATTRTACRVDPVVIDSSALICILLGEPEAARFNEVLAHGPRCVISAANWLEAAIVATAKLGAAGRADLDTVLAIVAAEVAPVDVGLAEAAYQTWLRYGKGRHPAGLNFGDCFSYALAKQRGEPLLYKGDDFSKTDVTPAL